MINIGLQLVFIPVNVCIILVVGYYHYRIIWEILPLPQFARICFVLFDKYLSMRFSYGNIETAYTTYLIVTGHSSYLLIKALR